MIFHGSPQSKAYRLQRYGFTLSEVMIAMVLLSIITQAVFSFYSIGISTYKRSSINAEIVASVRYLKKLVEEKISFKSNNNFNVFMKKDGFSDIPGFKNIMVENLEESNQPLYTALGFGGYLMNSGPDRSKSRMSCNRP